MYSCGNRGFPPDPPHLGVQRGSPLTPHSQMFRGYTPDPPLPFVLQHLLKTCITMYSYEYRGVPPLTPPLLGVQWGSP